MSETLTVAAVVPRTEAEGPGHRYALWVQGCPMRCPGCCNPEFLRFVGGEERTAADVIAEAMAEDVEGVSFLGGEPFAQAPALTTVAAAVRQAGRTVMIFTGYTLQELQAPMAPIGAAALLAQTDLLVDGRYDASQRTTERRWVGSDNQGLHFLTDRYTPDDPRFAEPNTLEIRIRGDQILVNGFPVRGARTKL
ncbi:MAG: radical SAM protein [Myxococcales bacterium]|nr:radical SAM protein [Myxococcales bacterium]